MPWQLVGFKAGDGWGGSDLAYLLIHVVQPPRAYGAHAWVPRGGTSTATIYVSDPDNSSHTFAFDEPAGITVRVVGQEEPRDYEQGGGPYYTVEVTADRALYIGARSCLNALAPKWARKKIWPPQRWPGGTMSGCFLWS